MKKLLQKLFGKSRKQNTAHNALANSLVAHIDKAGRGPTAPRRLG